MTFYIEENENDCSSELFGDVKKLSVTCKCFVTCPARVVLRCLYVRGPSSWLSCKLGFLSFALMWKMALPQVGAHWTHRPALLLGWFFIPPSPGTASRESFLLNQTATMTCHQRRCRETLHFQVSSKYELSGSCLHTYFTFNTSES